MRARSVLEAEMSTLVIHMDDRSTDFLKTIYEGKGYPVITGNMSQRQAEEQIEAHARIFMLGHGGPFGLFTRGFLVDERLGSLLAQKEDGLYIWCNADAYAVNNKLTGLVSGMFISEVTEAAMFGIQASQEEVNASNAAFSKTVREVLDSGQPHSEVAKRYAHATCKITKFNNERLYVFDHGNPSPALHSSSASHRCTARTEYHPQKFNQQNFAQPIQNSDQSDDLSDLYALVSYWVKVALDGQASAEEAAMEIAHATYSPGYVETLTGTIETGLRSKRELDDIVTQVVNVVGF